MYQYAFATCTHATCMLKPARVPCSPYSPWSPCSPCSPAFLAVLAVLAVLAALAVLPSLQSLLSCCPCSPADCVSQRHYSSHIQAVLAVPQPAQSLQSMRFAGIHALGSGDSHRWQVYHAKKYQGVFYKFEDAVAAKASAMNITPAELKKRSKAD